MCNSVSNALITLLELSIGLAFKHYILHAYERNALMTKCHQ